MMRWPICITCGQPLSRDKQDWFWHGEQSNPEHFACQRLCFDYLARLMLRVEKIETEDA